jgi:hypothetical protein
MKVFDCQKMPDEVRKEFFAEWDKGNDTYVEWDLEELPDGRVAAWLIENGAEKDEEVLVSHWW